MLLELLLHAAFRGNHSGIDTVGRHGTSLYLSSQRALATSAPRGLHAVSDAAHTVGRDASRLRGGAGGGGDVRGGAGGGGDVRGGIARGGGGDGRGRSRFLFGLKLGARRFCLSVAMPDDGSATARRVSDGFDSDGFSLASTARQNSLHHDAGIILPRVAAASPPAAGEGGGAEEAPESRREREKEQKREKGAVRP